MLTGENGIITQAQQANIKNDNGTVLEALRLKLSQYLSENEGTYVKDKLELLRDDNIIDENNIVNVLELVEQKLDTGNGNNNKDIYVIEENHLYYYDKKGNKTDLGDLGNIEENIAETDPSLFFVDDYGNIYVKEAGNYYANKKEWTVENVVIPSEIDGKKVTGISQGIFCTDKGGYKNIKTIVIPNGVEYISNDAFRKSNITSIFIPSSVQTIGGRAFDDCKNLETVYYGGTEEQWKQIEIREWNYALTDAKIVYNVQEYK